jgi:predicted adenine nucleotide alpha hydrolase (AANH) superfamily ATPase
MKSKSLIVHVCCAPCLSGLSGYLKSLDFERIKGIFYNPNIHPYKEFKKRRHNVRSNEKIFGFDGIEYSEEYPLKEILKGMMSADDRCIFCFRSRLEKTAEIAVKGEFSHFTTTLLISPYQKRDLIVKIGKEIAERNNLVFLDEDMRRFYDSGQSIAKDHDIYCQGYCGCIFSEYERYSGKSLDREST